MGEKNQTNYCNAKDQELLHSMQLDYQWFNAHRDEIRAKYKPNIYFAIRHTAIIGKAKDFGSLEESVYSELGAINYLAVHIDEVLPTDPIDHELPGYSEWRG
ncbi:MAG: hypothetical protein AABY07_02955 [Nanoarchaeota archaeon]